MPDISANFIKLDLGDNLQPGDDLRIEVEQNLGIISDLVGAAIESRLRSDSRLDLYDWNRTENSMIYSVRVKEPDPLSPEAQEASLFTPGVIIAAIVGIAAIFTSITVYKTVNSPGGKVISTSMIAIAVIVLAYLYTKVKK